jgi:hypothetical protein
MSGAKERAETNSFWKAARPVIYSGASGAGFAVDVALVEDVAFCSEEQPAIIASNRQESSSVSFLIFRAPSFGDNIILEPAWGVRMDTYITKAKRLIEEATKGLSESELTGSRDGKWSPARVLEHLAKAFGGSAKAFELQVRAGELKPLRKLTFKERAGIFLVCTIGYFPEGRNAPEMTLPSENPEGATTLRRALENLDRADKALHALEEKWGTRDTVYTHPVLGPLTVPQWRKFHYVHTRHHMKQVVERAKANRANAKGMRA